MKRDPDRSRIRLQERDIELLRLLKEQRVLTRMQCEALGLFRSTPRANYRLKQLTNARLIRMVGDIGVSRARCAFYALSARGEAALQHHLSPEAAERLSAVSSRFTRLAVDHSLAITECRILFVRANADGTMRLDYWLSELLCRHVFREERAHAKCVMKPDAVAKFYGPQERLCFLEVDMGTMSLARIDEKIRRYASYQQSQAFKEVYGALRPELLLLTSGPERARRLVRCARATREVQCHVTSLPALLSAGLTAPVWLGHPRPYSLLDYPPGENS